MQEPKRKAAIAFIFITVVLDVLSLGVVIPVAPKLIEDFCQGNTGLAADYVGWFHMVWAMMHFICSPIIGSLSDRFGRRPVLLVSCVGLGFDYILMALAPTLTWLFIGRIIAGITAASFSTAGAYIADVTPVEKRAAGFGIFGAAWGIGFVLGPALGGAVSYLFGLRAAFWVAAFLTLLNAAYGYWVLPESLPCENRKPFSWKRANPLGSFKMLSSHPELLGLAGVFFLYQLAHQVYQVVFVLYAGARYNWTELTVGLTLTVVGVLNVIVQGALIRPMIKRFGERPLLFLGLFCGGLGYALYGLAATPVQFWMAMPIAAMMGFFNPSLQGLMTRRVQPNEYGQLQGANSGMMAISGMIGPVMFAQVFELSLAPNSPIPFLGSPFLLAALLMLVGLILAVRVTIPNSENVLHPQSEVPESA